MANYGSGKLSQVENQSWRVVTSAKVFLLDRQWSCWVQMWIQTLVQEPHHAVISNCKIKEWKWV